MENYFSYYQKCKSGCNFYWFFKIPLANYDDSGKCMLDEAQERHCSFHCPFCKMITFLDFEVAVNKSAVIFKEMMVCGKITKANKGGKDEEGKKKKT